MNLNICNYKNIIYTLIVFKLKNNKKLLVFIFSYNSFAFKKINL